METLKLSDNNSSDIIDLSEYKEPAELPQQEPEKPILVDMGVPVDEKKPLTPEWQQENFKESTQPDWKGNPEYFQSGPKQGQKRQRKPRTTVHYTGKYEESEVSGDIITGAMFISIIDLLIPMVFVTVNNYLTGEKLKPGDMSLSAEQQRKLEPVADKAMSYIKLRGNPLILLGLTMLGLYSMQLVKAKMEYKVKMMNDKNDEKK